jgi:hypothetical protein
MNSSRMACNPYEKDDKFTRTYNWSERLKGKDDLKDQSVDVRIVSV